TATPYAMDFRMRLMTAPSTDRAAPFNRLCCGLEAVRAHSIIAPCSTSDNPETGARGPQGPLPLRQRAAVAAEQQVRALGFRNLAHGQAREYEVPHLLPPWPNIYCWRRSARVAAKQGCTKMRRTTRPQRRGGIACWQRPG